MWGLTFFGLFAGLALPAAFLPVALIFLSYSDCACVVYACISVCLFLCVCVCPFVVVPTSMSAVSPNDSLVPAFASDGTLHASTLFMVFYGILWHFIASSKDAHPLTHTHTHTDADNRQFSKAYTKSNRIAIEIQIKINEHIKKTCVGLVYKCVC